MAEQIALFLRINNAIGVGQLYLRVGTTTVFIWAVGEHYLDWWSSQSESSSIVDRVSTKDLCSVSVSYSMVLTFTSSRVTLEIWCVALSWIEMGML